MLHVTHPLAIPVSLFSLSDYGHITQRFLENKGLPASLFRNSPGHRQIVWPDPFDQGPLLPGLPLLQLVEARARWWTDFQTPVAGRLLLRQIRRDLAVIQSGVQNHEVVLWFGPSTGAQFLLIKLLVWCAECELLSKEGSLAQISFVPNWRAPAGGYHPDKLVHYFRRRRPILEGHLRQARGIWRKICSPDPRALATLATKRSKYFPSLDHAIRLHLESFPHIATGLTAVETSLLNRLRKGPQEIGRLVGEEMIAQHERHNPVGDLLLAGCIRNFLGAVRPLLRADQSTQPGYLSRQFWTGDVYLTPFGAKVLDGTADHVASNGIDRWLGGVHLAGREVPWRWDPQRSEIINLGPNEKR